jgi:hypothetical protein
MNMAVNYDDVEVGNKMPVYTSAPITRTHLVRYAGASGDFNPLHYDQTFAKMIGMKNIIVHGMLIMGIAGEAITSWIENKYLRKFSVRFLNMTEPVDLDDMENTKDRATIIVTGEVHHCSRYFRQQKALGIFYCSPALITGMNPKANCGVSPTSLCSWDSSSSKFQRATLLKLGTH